MTVNQKYCSEKYLWYAHYDTNIYFLIFVQIWVLFFELSPKFLVSFYMPGIFLVVPYPKKNVLGKSFSKSSLKNWISIFFHIWLKFVGAAPHLYENCHENKRTRVSRKMTPTTRKYQKTVMKNPAWGSTWNAHYALALILVMNYVKNLWILPLASTRAIHSHAVVTWHPVMRNPAVTGIRLDMTCSIGWA